MYAAESRGGGAGISHHSCQCQQGERRSSRTGSHSERGRGSTSARHNEGSSRTSWHGHQGNQAHPGPTPPGRGSSGGGGITKVRSNDAARQGEHLGNESAKGDGATNAKRYG